jgi:pyruvate kinase
MIEKANLVGKPVVTATQMLESMIKAPRPTRAEAGDVANAVLDGTDCVMLSGESANGDYPLNAVTIMAKICVEAEKMTDYRRVYNDLRLFTPGPLSTAESVASAAVAVFAFAMATTAITTAAFAITTASLATATITTTAIATASLATPATLATAALAISQRMYRMYRSCLRRRNPSLNLFR